MSRIQFQAELESLRHDLVEMGNTTLALFDEAASMIADPTLDRTEQASELESKTDHQHRMIHDECLDVITLQAPVARDARFVTGVLDAIVDLELIGDYAYEIATLAAGIQRRPPSQVSSQISDVAKKIRGVLSEAAGAWRSEHSAQGLQLRAQETAIRAECAALYDKLAQLTSSAGEATMYVDLMLISRHMERILRHAVSVGEEAIVAAPRE